jgi:hypothetical protein
MNNLISTNNSNDYKKSNNCSTSKYITLPHYWEGGYQLQVHKSKLEDYVYLQQTTLIMFI